VSGASPRTSELFELALYRLSPVGPVLTTTLIGLVVYGLFILNVWATNDLASFVANPGGQNMLRVAFILTLILCAALAVSLYDERANARDGAELEREFGLSVPSHRQGSKGIRVASLLGLVGGIGFLGFLIWANVGSNVMAFVRSPGLWFIPMTPFLWMLMARGVYGSVNAGRFMSRLIRDELTIDLYRHHQLTIFGRIAMRGAFIWLIFVGIILLSFPEGGTPAFAEPTLAIAITIATFNFVTTMQPIRKKISAAKEVELAAIRERLAEARQQMAAGAVGADIPALIALEARIESTREWPLNLPTAARLPLYLLIPVVPWAAGIYVEALLNRFMGGG